MLLSCDRGFYEIVVWTAMLNKAVVTGAGKLGIDFRLIGILFFERAIPDLHFIGRIVGVIRII